VDPGQTPHDPDGALQLVGTLACLWRTWTVSLASKMCVRDVHLSEKEGAIAMRLSRQNLLHTPLQVECDAKRHSAAEHEQGLKLKEAVQEWQLCRLPSRCKVYKGAIAGAVQHQDDY
jgi:hypothetical protein